MRCPSCGTEIAAGQTFCPTCRARGSLPAARPVAPPPALPSFADRHERLFLVLACLLAAGPLAIPRLLRSKAFGRVGKAVLTTLALLQTALVVALLVFAVVEAPALWQGYQDLLRRQVYGY
jgi:hypothetical protein